MVARALRLLEQSGCGHQQPLLDNDDSSSISCTDGCRHRWVYHLEYRIRWYGNLGCLVLSQQNVVRWFCLLSFDWAEQP
jgi:hypothetical protein